MKTVELQLDDEVAALLVALAGSPRKQSAYITRLLREQAHQRPLVEQIDALAAELERLRIQVAAQEPLHDRRP